MHPIAYVVTGASGYIGFHLARRLVSCGHVVHAVVRENSDRERLLKLGTDLVIHEVATDQSQLNALMMDIRPESVFHLAGGKLGDEGDTAQMIEANINFGLRVIEAMTAAGIRRLINTGTYWQFAADGTTSPNGLYAASKQALQDLIKVYEHSGALESVHLTLFDVYGPGDWRPKLLNRLLSLATEPIELTAGQQQLDMVYIDDVVDAFVIANELLVRSPIDVRNSTFTVGTGNLISLRDLVGYIDRMRGIVIDARWGVKPYLPEQIFEPMPANAPLPGWQPSIDISAGLLKIFEDA